MVTVNSCCCFGLETGALILGWLGIIGNAITGLFLLAMLAGYNSITCEDIFQNPQFQEAFSEYTVKDCQLVKTIILVVIIVGCVVTLIGFIVDVLLVKGIKDRNPGKIIPAVIITGITTVVMILGYLFTFSLQGLVSAVIGGAISIYFFLVLYSAYVSIRDEKRRSYSAQYAHA